MERKDAIRLIKERINIVDVVRRYVDLKRNGPRWAAPCPFHQETKPSFSVNEDQGLFYCFGCQASGDLFDFYARINGLDFTETVEQLALEAGIHIDAWKKGNYSGKDARKAQSSRQRMLRMYQLAQAHFVENLEGPNGATCRAYLEQRKLTQEIIQRFGIGWAMPQWGALAQSLQRAGFSEKEAIEAGLLARSEKSGRGYDRFRGRLMFPIQSLANQIIAFGGRIIDDEDTAKYINSSDSPIYKKGDHLYGLAQARRGITLKRNVLLTEGYMDALSLHQFGYSNAVGVLGTAFTQEQVKRLSGFTSSVVLLFDADNAGRKAALRACEMLLAQGLACKVVLLPEGEDIDSFLHSKGTEAFNTLQEHAPDGLTFCTDTLRQMAPREAVDWARKFLQSVTVQELISPYASKLATSLNLAEDTLRHNTLQARQRNHDKRQGEKGTQLTARGSQGKLTPVATRDKQIMMYAVRYPHRLHDLRNLGADLALSTSVAKDLWHKIEEFGPEEVFYHLSEREKAFWVQCRTGEAAPVDEKNEGDGDKELKSLSLFLESFNASMQKSSLTAALRESAKTGDFEAELDYLRALQETLGRFNEQS